MASGDLVRQNILVVSNLLRVVFFQQQVVKILTCIRA